MVSFISRSASMGRNESEVEAYELKVQSLMVSTRGQKTLQSLSIIECHTKAADNLTLYHTSITMPDVFTDDDGEITAYEWNFPNGVNLDGGITDQDDDFVQTQYIQRGEYRYQSY